MPVFRTEKVSDYAVIAKHHLKNKALSYKAKGLMTFMLSLPEAWDFSLSGLATLSSDGIDGVRSGISELEKHGYLTRRRIRDAGGRLGDIEYTIHEIPQIPGGDEPEEALKKPPPKPDAPELRKPTLENPILENPTLVNPTLEKPILDFPTLVKPTQENPMQISNKELSIKELSIKGLNNKQTQSPRLSAECVSTGGCSQLSLTDDYAINQQAERLTVKTAQGADNSANHAMTLAEQQFDTFWQSYPRKAGKKAAKKAWSDISLDEALFSTIMSALNTSCQYWKLHNVSTKHIPHPSTWLNEERWEDEFTAEQLSEQKSNNPILNKGGGHNARIGTDYAIGGENDPYRNLTQG